MIPDARTHLIYIAERISETENTPVISVLRAVSVNGESVFVSPHGVTMPGADIVDLAVQQRSNRLFCIGSYTRAYMFKIAANGSLRPDAPDCLDLTGQEDCTGGPCFGESGRYLFIACSVDEDPMWGGQPPIPIIECRILANGGIVQMSPHGARPVPYPEPFVDATGRYLYILGDGTGNKDGTVDAYRIGSDGSLTWLQRLTGFQDRIAMNFYRAGGK